MIDNMTPVTLKHYSIIVLGAGIEPNTESYSLCNYGQLMVIVTKAVVLYYMYMRVFLGNYPFLSVAISFKN